MPRPRDLSSENCRPRRTSEENVTVREAASLLSCSASHICRTRNNRSQDQSFAKLLTMSLMLARRRIDAKEVAQLLGCSRKTVLNGKGGTSSLTRIHNGSQVRFLLEEVLQLMRKQEQNKNLSVRDLQSYEINGQSHTSTL